MAVNRLDSDTKEIYTAIGLMSGTSLDGIDAALIRTDGTTVLEHGPTSSRPYGSMFRQKLRSYLGKPSASPEIIEEITSLHAGVVLELVAKNDLQVSDIDLIGFHGQTIFHDPANRVTVQIGDGQLMADLTRIDTVAGFRHEDVAAGGEGAPFAPLYHRALANDLDLPVAVLNLGGVGNVTYIDTDTILAFDTGPANALIDDWVLRHSGRRFDEGGKIAAAGRINTDILRQLLDNSYFEVTPPKSLDRDEFPADLVDGLSLEDGAATLMAFSVESIGMARVHLPGVPRRWLLTGGGRKNPELVRRIAEIVDAPVGPVEDVGWRGDDLEAEAFAFLAVRSLKGLPLSLPLTTGVPSPMTGGTLYSATSNRIKSAS